MNGSPAAAVTAATLVATLVVATALPAAAQTAPAPAASAVAPAMGMPEVIALLRERGYSDIREIERKGSRLYEVDARDPAGHRVELVIDARSGEILRSKRDY